MKKYRVKIVIENTGLYGVQTLYKIQERCLWFWINLSNPTPNREWADATCAELNKEYNDSL